jgi:hypothetical protein
MSTDVNHRQKSAKDDEGSERSQNGLRNARRAVHKAAKTRAENVRDLMLTCNNKRNSAILQKTAGDIPKQRNRCKNSHALKLHVWLHSYRSTFTILSLQKSTPAFLHSENAMTHIILRICQ